MGGLYFFERFSLLLINVLCLVAFAKVWEASEVWVERDSLLEQVLLQVLEDWEVRLSYAHLLAFFSFIQ